jgi:glycosyltransferase involved in cell wall biosynthesis
VTFLVPGAITTRTGGTIYDRRVTRALQECGWHVEIVECPGPFPAPAPADRAAIDDVLASHPDRSIVVIDGLIFGSIPEIAAKHGPRLRLVALVHHPLALETGLAEFHRLAMIDDERAALSHAAAVITTSAITAATLSADYGVDAARLTIAEPGVDRVVPRSIAPGPAVLRLLTVGAIIPRKGHDVLIDALRLIRDLPFSARIVGNEHRAPATTDALKAAIARAGLMPRVILTGEVEDVDAEYANADIFVLPSRYEGYGMVFGEALAHGLPIVATDAGAIPGVVPADAGILVSPDDPAALAAALRDLITEPARYEICATAARNAGQRLPRWCDTARQIAVSLRRLDGAAPG